jgi:hypothetical protein
VRDFSCEAPSAQHYGEGRDAESGFMSRIRDAMGSVISVIERRPQTGQDTDQSTTTLVSGLACVSEEGDWRFDTDLPETMGGQGSGPHSGCLRAQPVPRCVLPCACDETNVDN